MLLKAIGLLGVRVEMEPLVEEVFIFSAAQPDKAAH